MTPGEVLAGIRDGNYHQGGLRCLRLLRLDDRAFADLRADVARLCERQPPSDVRARDHVTNWTHPRGEVLQYSLLNRSGRCDDFSSDHDQSCQGKRFSLGAEHPSLARFIEGFPHAINARVNVLGPGARLSAHEEHSVIRTRDGSVGVCARFHLPLETAPGAELTLDGEVFHLEPGVVHFVNHGCVHSARNRGAGRRVHLVWDLLLTREAYQATFGERPPPWCAPITDRAPAPLATERMGAHARLPAPVERGEAERLDLCQPQ